MMDNFEAMIVDPSVEQILIDKSVIQAFKDRIKELEAAAKDMVPMKLVYQQYIEHPPMTKDAMYTQTCSNDGPTIKSWNDKWLRYVADNYKNYDCKANSAMSEFGKSAYKPVLVAGSGPSLKRNIKVLAKDKPRDISLVSCLHNFGFFLDNAVATDYFLNLDAGDIVIPELCQGGKKDVQYYWDATKDYTLLAGLVSPPELIRRWKGRVLWFDAPVGDPGYIAERNKICPDFQLYFNVGGNALGASYYFARAVLGGCPIAFVGADYAFDYTQKFHPFDSPYDTQFAGLVPSTDVFGNRVYSWQSYQNFKIWMEHQSLGGNGNNPHLFINCTEGGTLGSYPNGNIRSIIQMGLIDFFHMYTHHQKMPEVVANDPIKDPGKPKLLF